MFERPAYPFVGDKIDLKSVADLFSEYIPPSDERVIDWSNLDEITENRYVRIGIFNYCDYAEISLNTFSFNYPYEHYGEYLEKKLNIPEYPLFNYINKFAKILNMEDYPYYDYTATYFYFENKTLKVAHETIFVDPCNENDDGVMFLLFDNMDISKYIEEVEAYFHDRFIRYLKLPDELNKPMYLMSEDEIAVLRMYIYE
jgi:hypothetical protein